MLRFANAPSPKSVKVKKIISESLPRFQNTKQIQANVRKTVRKITKSRKIGKIARFTKNNTRKNNFLKRKLNFEKSEKFENEDPPTAVCLRTKKILYRAVNCAKLQRRADSFAREHTQKHTRSEGASSPTRDQ